MKKVHFLYTKTNGDTSERVVLQLYGMNSNLMGLDISEFDEDERDVYEAEIERAHANFMDEIKDIGLGSNWRQFKPDGISWQVKDDS